VVSNLRDLLPNPPEVTEGEALLHDVSKLQSGGGVDGVPDARFSGALPGSLRVGCRTDGDVSLGVMPLCRAVSG